MENGTISFGEVVSTLIACEDQSVMEQEQQYLQALESAGNFELRDDRLVIFYNEGQGALNFTRMP